jgi:5-hydroxyisourate hydrolase
VISTHILDLCKGIPASGVGVRLLKKTGEQWQEVSNGVTDKDGRYTFENAATAGLYQIIFATENYLQHLGDERFFADVPVVFKIETSSKKTHVPLLLSSFGYSTYRGS